ncbi:MAG: cupredoxin domain-containing protein [Chloroflexi bacterium]|nr:cupredoxin domain-containing protein [Chloroflexota bacterium]
MKWTLMLVLIAVFIPAGCGVYGGGGSQATPSPAAGGISVTSSYAKFQPAQIELTKDKATQLSLTSSDVGHTFTVDELGINITIPAGKSVTQNITATKSGTYAFYCAVPGHRAAGMEGKITVK